MLFQTGYLTIKDSIGHPAIVLYTLDFPNTEVMNGFNSWLIDAYNPVAAKNGELLKDRIACANALNSCEVDKFIEQFKSFVSGIPYQLLKDASEAQYQSIMYTFFYSIAMLASAEVNTNLGRIDIVVETEKFTYIIELKLDKSPEEALSQIQDKQYYAPYIKTGKQTVLMGIDFSSSTRNIDGYLTEIA